MGEGICSRKVNCLTDLFPGTQQLEKMQAGWGPIPPIPFVTLPLSIMEHFHWHLALTARSWDRTGGEGGWHPFSTPSMSYWAWTIFSVGFESQFDPL